ncbi:MAG TPA: nickel/cobalt transporter [Hyphomicrobiaceae bacterium]|nr:nickel/cobalt transporter [Hyphomicrobiaceae bacterium]
MTIPRALRILALVMAALVLPATAQAQQTEPRKSPFGAEKSLVQPRAAEPGSNAGLLQRAGSWLLEKQAQLNRELATAVRGLKSADPFSATLTLAFLSFAYGVLHAAGPGHGKAVISSYVLADGRTVRRGILLAFLAALIQALSALVLVGVLVLVLRSTGMQIRLMEAWLETISWGLVALVGAWLVYYQLRGAFAGQPAHARGHGQAHGHDHGHPHDHMHDHHGHHHRAHDHAHVQHHNHAHQHGRGDACEMCAHLPDPNQLKGDWSWKRALALAFAVGVRPCTGAILVLVFAIGQGLMWAGVLSTFAMAIGTAITVSALAASAVGFRELATRLAGGAASPWTGRIQLAAGLGGASLVLILGAVFFVGSLGTIKPF